jgi:hypothetical protein
MLKKKLKRARHEWKHDKKKKKKKSKKRLVTHRANTHPSCDLLAAATSWPSPLVDLQQKKTHRDRQRQQRKKSQLWGR